MIAANLGRLFEVGFNIGILAYNAIAPIFHTFSNCAIGPNL